MVLLLVVQVVGGGGDGAGGRGDGGRGDVGGWRWWWSWRFWCSPHRAAGSSRKLYTYTVGKAPGRAPGKALGTRSRILGRNVVV